jgi:hypothetical protein
MENKMTSQAIGTTSAETKTIEMPASTAWPVILAFGLTLVFAGLVTSLSVSLLGAILAVTGSIGWFREVLPHERHESVSTFEKEAPIITSRPQVAVVEWRTQELPRARLPLEIYPISAGVKGGLAGSVAMAVLAMLYGIISRRGMWYAVNVLAAGFFPIRNVPAQIGAFQSDSLLIAGVVHLLLSLLVGLLYGAMLPMYPRRPILLGGLIVPIVWSVLVHGVVDLIAPPLNQRIDWAWFVLSQVGFGIVAGIIVTRQERIRTLQYFPLALRAGFEAPGVVDENDGGKTP